MPRAESFSASMADVKGVLHEMKVNCGISKAHRGVKQPLRRVDALTLLAAASQGIVRERTRKEGGAPKFHGSAAAHAMGEQVKGLAWGACVMATEACIRMDASTVQGVYVIS